MSLKKEEMLENDPLKMNLHEEDIASTITLLESIAPKVFYVPGNHDPPDLFNPEYVSLTPYSHNMHEKCIEVRKDLFLIGLGGSGPAEFLNPETMKKTKDEYGAFPFDSDSDIEVKIKSLLSNSYA